MESKDTSQQQIMQAHIAALKLSGQTVAEYCVQHKIKAHQYYYWQKKLQPLSAGSNFIKMSALQTAGPLRVVFANGHQVNFATLPPVDYLKQLIQ